MGLLQHEDGRNDEKVTINRSEYEMLLRDGRKLAALEQAGVDNWEWYGEAMDIFHTWNEDYDDYNEGDE